MTAPKYRVDIALRFDTLRPRSAAPPLSPRAGRNSVIIRRVVRLIATAMSSAIALSVVIWATLALWFDGPSSRPLAVAMCAATAIISLSLAVRVRPYSRGLLAAILPAVVVMAWWVSIAPSTSRNWTPDVARTANAVFQGSSVIIRNVRNFEYRSETDYDQHWDTRTYDLGAIRGF